MNQLYVKLIAELGINHFGSFENAKALIEASSTCGVEMIKFQYRNLERTYSNQRSHLEIGDEIIQKEIRKNYLCPDSLCALADFARSKGILPGISFFNVDDIDDIAYEFEFYKIPSVELRNMTLIGKVIDSGKKVFISTGCATEQDLICVTREIERFSNWMFMHCVSNYPVSPQNAMLGYIKRLEDLSSREVGYSSHDREWEYCILAAALGATVIERHITTSRDAEGLDHTSSSTFAEFSRMSQILKHLPEASRGCDAIRTPNQGERLNLQNLGRSLYSKRDYKIGDIIKPEDLEQRVPCVGIRMHEFKEYEATAITQRLRAGEALSLKHFATPAHLKPFACEHGKISTLNAHSLSLPVRIHDFSSIHAKFALDNYEFHLSYEEILAPPIDVTLLPQNCKYSIHLPDYISSTQIIDPFSEVASISERSLNIITRTKQFAQELHAHTKAQVPIVGSFSRRIQSRSVFYKKCKQLISEFSDGSSILLPQWLPPVAWYFGGSVELASFNCNDDIGYLEDLEISICLDICHFLMCLASGFVQSNDFDRLLACSKHLHLADATGTDGEGIQLFAGAPSNKPFLMQALKHPTAVKVVEVWQGHLQDFKGFSEALSIAGSILE